MVSNGDSLAGPDLVSPPIYREFALPARRPPRGHAGLPYVLHICGRTDRILDDMVATGASGLELDHKTDVRLAREIDVRPGDVFRQPRPSGVLALGTPAAGQPKTRNLLDVFADAPRFILIPGRAIPATTPPENLRAMIPAARG